jgi:hypothetical protein
VRTIFGCSVPHDKTILGGDSCSRTESVVMSGNGEFGVEGDHRANRYQEWQTPPLLTMFSCWELQKFALISKAHEKMVYSQACYLYFRDDDDLRIDVFQYLFHFQSQERIHLVFFGDHMLDGILRLCFGGHPRIYMPIPTGCKERKLRVSIRETNCFELFSVVAKCLATNVKLDFEGEFSLLTPSYHSVRLWKDDVCGLLRQVIFRAFPVLRQFARYPDILLPPALALLEDEVTSLQQAKKRFNSIVSKLHLSLAVEQLSTGYKAVTIAPSADRFGAEFILLTLRGDKHVLQNSVTTPTGDIYMLDSVAFSISEDEVQFCCARTPSLFQVQTRSGSLVVPYSELVKTQVTFRMAMYRRYDSESIAAFDEGLLEDNICELEAFQTLCICCGKRASVNCSTERCKLHCDSASCQAHCSNANVEKSKKRSRKEELVEESAGDKSHKKRRRA